ncbi:MAG: pyrophosphatase PpaX [Coprobacillaceae bacterium]
MNRKLGILFDLDGTVLDTEELIFESFKYVFRKYKPGYTLSKEELLSFLGPSLKDSFERFFDSKIVDELIEYYREFNHAKHEEYVTIYPTVVETLETLKKEGYPLAIVTTKANHVAHIGLDLFDLTKYFDSVVGLDDVKTTKPNPEGIYKAMKELRVDKAVMIGDNITDIQAGKNAGVYTIGVKWAAKGYQEMAKLEPDLLIDEMSEILDFIKEIGE